MSTTTGKRGEVEIGVFQTIVDYIYIYIYIPQIAVVL